VEVSVSDPVTAIVVSDLHLGERDSVFSRGEDPDVEFAPQPAETLACLLAAALAGQGEQAEYLILAGDVLDFSQASRTAAFLGFKSFLEQVAPLFRTLIYVPGNHDHHVWVALQEEARIFAQIRQGQPVLPYYDAFVPTIEAAGLVLPASIGGTTPADGHFVSRPIGVRTFLYALLPDSARDRSMDFLVAYPNVHFRLGDRRVLVTHGHFFEDAWTLVTDALPQSLAAGPMTYAELERFNSPFTEFGWYLLGQAGRLSELLEEAWKELHVRPGGPFPNLDRVAGEIGAFLDERLDFTPARRTGLRRFFANRVAAPVAEWTSDRIIDLLLAVAKKLLAAQATIQGDHNLPGSALRDLPDVFASPRTAAKAARFLEMAEAAPEPFYPTDLVYGHTHVPAAGLTLETPAGPVVVSNTGGWLVDNTDARQLALSRPAIAAVERRGTIRQIEVGWPEEAQFAAVASRVPNEAAFRREVKALVWRALASIL